jgi:hypothetical protein
MAEPQRKAQIETETSYEPVIIEAVVDNTPRAFGGAKRICWNTGEEKNCPSCYLSKGCKAR